ncbi:MAG: hypothetical protein IKV74_03755, partial [Clostridia bacterium]|nr:hypothetical protein [Clostridia bacterium]
MNDLRNEIMELLANGKITAQEAEMMLNRLQESKKEMDYAAEINRMKQTLASLNTVIETLKKNSVNTCHTVYCPDEDSADLAEEVEDLRGEIDDLRSEFEELQEEVETLCSALQEEGVHNFFFNHRIKEPTVEEENKKKYGISYFSFDEVERKKWFIQRDFDRKKRNADRDKRNQDRIRREGDRKARATRRMSSAVFNKEEINSDVLTEVNGDILANIGGSVYAPVKGDIHAEIGGGIYGDIQGDLFGKVDV